MERVFVIFTSYISSGRCIIIENFILSLCVLGVPVWSRRTQGKQHSEHQGAQRGKECDPGFSGAVLSKLGAALSSFSLDGLNKDLVVLAILTFVEIHHLESLPPFPTSHPVDT